MERGLERKLNSESKNDGKKEGRRRERRKEMNERNGRKMKIERSCCATEKKLSFDQPFPYTKISYIRQKRKENTRGRKLREREKKKKGREWIARHLKLMDNLCKFEPLCRIFTLFWPFIGEKKKNQEKKSFENCLSPEKQRRKDFDGKESKTWGEGVKELKEKNE